VRWGRVEETYGEDPFLTSLMGRAYVAQFERAGVVATPKHFIANVGAGGRDSYPIDVSRRRLEEYFFPPFRAAITEGAQSIMTAYNSVNGEWCGQSHQLLTDVLRGEWGFGGFVISDWIFGLRDAAVSLSAGLDVEMPYRMLRMRDLQKALDEGRASWDDVDAAVEHVVSTLLRFDDVLSRPAPP
jgi:beta-glucosidase-like glycosyl hydrolase